MDTWRARLVVLACVFTVLTFAGPAIAGEHLVFDAFLGAQLTPTGVDPNRDYFFAAGMAVDSRGFVYVADPVNHSVLIYDGLGVRRVTGVCCYTAYGDGFLARNVSVVLKFPMSVAVDPRNDDVWITSTLTGQVIKMDKDQRLLNFFGGRGTGPGQFETPIRVAVDSVGNLYVLDDGGRTYDVRRSYSTSDANVRIQKFRADGTFVRAWGSLCEFSSASVGPCNASAAGAIVIGDGQFGFSHFLAVVDPRGPTQQGFQVSQVGMAVDSLGNVYVADQDRVQKFNTNGVFLTKWATSVSGADVAVDFADNVYVTEFDNDRIRKFDGTGRFLATAGSTGRGLGVFGGPAFIAALPRNLVAFCEFFIKPFDPKAQCREIYVAETRNLRVQVLQAREDSDDDSLVDEVDLDPTIVSDEAAAGNAGAHVLTRTGLPFVVYDPPSTSDTIRITAWNTFLTTGQPLTFDVALFCRYPTRPSGGRITIAGDNALDFHCSIPTLDILAGPIPWTFTAADGTVATATLTDGDSLSVDPTTSSIRSNAGMLALTVGGSSITLPAGQTIFADTTPPTTQAAVSPPANNGDVTVTLTTADNAAGSGVKEIAVALRGAHNSAATISGGVATIPITMDGSTTVTYFARDNAGNAEAAKSLTIRVDKTCALVKLYRPPDGARMLLGFDLAPETYGFREPDTTARLAFPVCEFSLEGEALPLK